MSYLTHFGLEKAPFSLTADPHFYIDFIPHKEALEVITTALSFGESILKITGEVGTGKTLLCNKLQQELSEQYHLCIIDNAYLSAHELRCLLASKIGIDKADFDEQFLLTEKIKERLLTLRDEGIKVLVLVDEAQALPDSTLEALRLFSNLETDADKLLQVILFGQPELDLRLADPKLRQLRQRITFSYQLRALSEQEIEHYISERLKQAGYRGARLFSTRVCRKISQASRGIPRLINILSHKILMLSYGEQHYKITNKLVKEAVADTEDAYALPTLTGWWLLLLSFIVLNTTLLLWWKGLL
ncbi:MSHA biogenesis protein MshM [Psychromonas marina]|uniref:MSHA biogenesis protein MshM n=1 Tax=Psychromonas marina TaxID=88364 RepID=A0ABQ6DWW4_9GAMM|nr:AAA family ATPase [Psychromonas marina]GLS89480.1 MSHA biogenesis protein MshM [Psychromonas marina]